MRDGKRALGKDVWGRKVARLPSRGTLLVATDLQGNLDDFQALCAVYDAEERAGHEPVLAFCGDLVHGPSPELNMPGAWPDYLGTPYRDESAELVREFDRLSRKKRIFSLLGNHEHAHIGGPTVSKFHRDEAAVLDRRLGRTRRKVHALFREFPLLATTDCGAVLVHGAPHASEPDLEAFERLSYDGYRRVPAHQMVATGTVGALLWARYAPPERARRLLDTLTAGLGSKCSFVVFGHDVVPLGYALVGDEQLCLSTSYGLDNTRKTYLRLDLSARYASARELREGDELLRLYPG